MARVSKSGVEIEELNNPSVLTITTKAPNKYLLIDRETGQVYQGKNPGVENKNHSWSYIETLSNKDIDILEKGLDNTTYSN